MATVPSEALRLCSSLQGFMEIPGLKLGSRQLRQTEFSFTSQKAHDKMSWPFCPISSLSLTWVAQPRTQGTCKLQATFVALFRGRTHLTLTVLDIAQTIIPFPVWSWVSVANTIINKAFLLACKSLQPQFQYNELIHWLYLHTPRYMCWGRGELEKFGSLLQPRKLNSGLWVCSKRLHLPSCFSGPCGLNFKNHSKHNSLSPALGRRFAMRGAEENTWTGKRRQPASTFGFDFFLVRREMCASNTSFWAWTQELGFLQGFSWASLLSQVDPSTPC